jgi:hypothetical protein
MLRRGRGRKKDGHQANLIQTGNGLAKGYASIQARQGQFCFISAIPPRRLPGINNNTSPDNINLTPDT